ncbi:MAG: hypothetical protein AAEJ53_03980, partial [Myxococcota bacterium]
LSIAMPAGSTGMRLQFWGKASQFGVSDELLVNVSVDGGPFTTFRTLRPQDQGLNDVGYAFLTASTTWVPATTSNIVLEFESNMSTGVFVIDSIEVRALIGNPSPVADAGPDQSADDAGGDGVESFTLDGSASFDSNGSIVSYEWRDGPTLLGSTASIGATLSLGVHTIVLTVTDDEDETASDSAVITVGTTGCVNDVDCDDEIFCNGAEFCDAQNDCQDGTPPVTDDGVGCTDDSCDEVTDAIVHAANDASCDNGQFCDGSETCHATLDCQPGTAVTIDDGVGCTDDSCDEVNDVVLHAANDASCVDVLFCNGAETCDVSLDCQPGTPPTTSDGVGCTDDSCDEVNDVVVNAINHASCDDTLFCNGVETCDASLDCQAGTSVAIDDSVTCTLDACDETLNSVNHVPDAGLCDDGDACTAEVCDPATGCANVAVPNCGVPVPSASPAALLLGALSLVAAARRRLRSPR